MIKDVKVIDGCIGCKNCEKTYPKIFKKIIINGNIPGINIFSRIIILLGLIGVPIQLL